MSDIKLVIRRPRAAACCGLVRVSPEAAETLRDLSAKTGLSLTEIASELIIQAARVVEIEEVEE